MLVAQQPLKMLPREKKVTKHGIEGGADGELFDDRSAQHQLVRIV
jgi:hypothetical protein